jgi:hypothetical protein
VLEPSTQPLEAGDELPVEDDYLTVKDNRGRGQVRDGLSSGKRRVWSRPFRLVKRTSLQTLLATMRQPSYCSS